MFVHKTRFESDQPWNQIALFFFHPVREDKISPVLLIRARSQGSHHGTYARWLIRNTCACIEQIGNLICSLHLFRYTAVAFFSSSKISFP